MKPSRTYLLTGATGLVGSYLLTILLRHNHKVFVLARSNGQCSASDRVLSRLSFWDKKLLKAAKAKVIVLEGDITDQSLGLSKKTLQILQDNVEEVFHCAAETKFNADIELLRDVNVTGTVNLLNHCLSWSRNGKLIKVNHISTAYICGNSKKALREKDCSINQTFTTPYQLSKYEAELIILKYRKLNLWVDIFRPPAIAGESTSGRTFSFDQAIYQSLKIINMDLLSSLPINENNGINLVFVDELCKALYLISKAELLKNSTYHMFPRKQLKLRSLLIYASKFLNHRKVSFVSHHQFAINSTHAQRMLLKNTLLFLSNMKLSSKETNKILFKLSFEFTQNNLSFFKKMLKYGIKSGFFKKNSNVN